MPAATTAKLALKYGWDVGENFKADMDANLKKLDRLIQLSVKDRDLTAPPGSPASGDMYIPAVGSTGAWAGHDGHVAAYESGWVFYTPQKGWVAFIEDENKLSAYYSGAWSAGISI